MRNFITNIVVLLSFVFAAGCATLSGNPGFVAFGACSKQAIEATGATLINDIATAFASGGYEAEIAKLIGKFGFDEVQCGVDLFIAEWSHKKALTPGGQTALTNARAYRAAHQLK